MRPLKKRIRPDNIPNERRVVRGRTARTIYILLLAVFGLAAANYLVGDFFLLEADGLVLRDQNVIAATYIARVADVDIREGQAVEAGTPLLKLQSSEILERLAEVSTKRAELAASRIDFKVKAENVSQLLPLAERRAAEATSTIKQFDSLADARLVTSARYQEALRESYEASRDRVNLVTQRQVLQDEMASLDTALAIADDAIEQLQKLYADGVVRSPVAGSIGATVPSVGNVYRPGETILTVYSGEPYVLVFLPRRYLFPITVGMEASVTDGRDVADGIISEILPVTDALPKEFQNTFKPSDRSQLAKISLQGRVPFPLNQKVSVSRYGSLLGGLLEARNWLGLRLSRS